MSKKHSLIGIGALVALAAHSSMSMAGSLDIESAPVNSVRAATAPKVQTTPAGMRQWNEPVIRTLGIGNAGLITSRGRNVELAQATKLIVPSNWTIYASPDVQSTMTVSWHASDRPWTDVLGEAIKGHRLYAVVNWDNHTVSFSVMKEETPVAAVTHALGSPAVVTVDAAAPRWVISSTSSMSETVRGWGKSAGWQVVWNATDWIPEATSSVSGDFKTAVGELVKAANSQHIALTATFYSNNIVVFGSSNTALNK